MNISLNRTLKTCVLSLLSIMTFAQSMGDFERYVLTDHGLMVFDKNKILLIQFLNNSTLKIQNFNQNETFYTYSNGIKGNDFNNFPGVIETENRLISYIGSSELSISKFPIRISLKSEFIDSEDPIFEETGGLSASKDTTVLSYKNGQNDVYQGSGARPFGMDFNGRVFNVRNSNNGNYYEDAVGFEQNINTPFIINSNKFGLLLDSDVPGSQRFDIGGFDSTEVNLRGIGMGRCAYYLFYGTNDIILEQYTKLTGKQQIPPRWVFGVLQSKDSYLGESEIKSVISNYERNAMPLDAIFFDKNWTGSDTTLGNFSFSPIGFPNPTSMLSELESKGVEAVLKIDANVHFSSAKFPFYSSQRLFASNSTGVVSSTNSPFGPVFLFDIYKNATKSVINSSLDDLVVAGADAFWTSSTEPRFFSNELVLNQKNIVQSKGFYSHEWAKALASRGFHFSNSGYIGSQRFGIIPRSGDVARFWTGFKLQIPIMLNAGMSGFAYMHSDIGGYATGVGQADKNEELDLRWLQMSVFSPILRFHGARTDTEPYQLKEPFLSHASEALKLRYALLPYIYSLAYLNSTTGRPFCLPMDYHEKSEYLRNRNDQYFFGEQLLIAPVMLYGTPVRRVDLPNGKWFDFWASEMHEGGEPIFQNVVLDHIPVYAKAGAIIPMATTNAIHLRNYKSDSLKILYFQDVSQKNSSFLLYEDDGLSGEIQNQEFIRLTAETEVNHLKFIISSDANSNPSLRKRIVDVVFKNLTSIPLRVSIDQKDLTISLEKGALVSDQVAFYNLERKELTVRLEWNNKNLKTVEVGRNGLEVLLSNEESLKPKFSIFSNPNKGFFWVEIVSQQNESFNLKVLNLKGELMLSKRIGNIDSAKSIRFPLTVNAPRGAYIVQLEGSLSDTQSKKMIITE